MSEVEFQRFYDETAPALHGYLRRGSGSVSLADDLTQESFFRLLRSGFETDDPDHRRAYLFRIASNLLRDHFRRRRPTAPLPERGADDPEIERREQRWRLDGALSVLSAKERQLLWLAHVERFSHREIAEMLDLAESSVRVLAFHARRKLAERLEDQESTPTESAARSRGDKPTSAPALRLRRASP